MNTDIRIATRQSKLALFQANLVKASIERQYPGTTVTLIKIVTKGDKRTDVPLNQVGGKSLFVKALQEALLNNEADMAVHCVKDMSVHSVDQLTITAVLDREDPRDVLISPRFHSIDTLPQGAVIGTASPRRACILKHLRPDVTIKLIRGNIDTRLQKCFDGEYDAIILAAAGLHRLSLQSHIRQYLPVDQFIPAIGQGALALECRADNQPLIKKLQFLNNAQAHTCVDAERRVNQILGGDCYSAVGAYATIVNNTIQLSALVGDQAGNKLIYKQISGPVADAPVLAQTIAETLIQAGALDLLNA